MNHISCHVDCRVCKQVFCRGAIPPESKNALCKDESQLWRVLLGDPGSHHPSGFTLTVTTKCCRRCTPFNGNMVQWWLWRLPVGLHMQTKFQKLFTIFFFFQEHKNEIEVLTLVLKSPNFPDQMSNSGVRWKKSQICGSLTSQLTEATINVDIWDFNVLKYWKVTLNNTPLSIIDHNVFKGTLPEWAEEYWQEEGSLGFPFWSLISIIRMMDGLQATPCILNYAVMNIWVLF